MASHRESWQPRIQVNRHRLNASTLMPQRAVENTVAVVTIINNNNIIIIIMDLDDIAVDAKASSKRKTT
jgi:hypothetical protein